MRYRAFGPVLALLAGTLLPAMARTGGTDPGKAIQEFTFDGPDGRMDSESIQFAGTKRTIRYRTQPDGAVDQLIYPEGRVVTYLYDSLGRITQINNNGAPLVAVAYDGWGNRASLRFSSGASSLWTASGPGGPWQCWQLIHAEGSETRAYQVDGLGHLTQAGEWLLQHDSQGQLIQASGFNLSLGFAYDASGHNIHHSAAGALPATIQAFSFAAQPDHHVPETQTDGTLTGWAMASSGAASQLGTGAAPKGLLKLEWDGLGRLAAVTDVQTGGRQQYGYAPSGLRVGLWDSLDPARNRHFVYASNGLLLAEYLGGGQWKRDVIYLGPQAIAEVDATGVHELHCDHLGTPRAITAASSGVLEGRQAFGPYGERIDLPPHTEGYRPLTGFTGHLQTEDGTGLIYMRGRFYSPVWHRFLNPDPTTGPEAGASYGYADGSPFHGTDPSGFGKELPWAGSATVTVTGTYSTLPSHSFSPSQGGRADYYRGSNSKAPSTGPGSASWAKALQASVLGSTSPWWVADERAHSEVQVIPPLTEAEMEGSRPRYNRSGDDLGVDTLPLKPRPDQDTVMLVSRPVIGMLGLLVNHSATIVQTNGRDFIVQSGPVDDGSGLNQASIDECAAGQGVSTFGQEVVVKGVQAKWFVPAGMITEARMAALVTEWNSHRVPYYQKGRTIPITTCNTFSNWFESRLGLQTPINMATSTMYGWTKTLK